MANQYEAAARFRIDRDLLHVVDAKAKRERTTRSAIIRESLVRTLIEAAA